MTVPSRRAFAAAALASLLVSCSGSGGGSGDGSGNGSGSGGSGSGGAGNASRRSAESAKAHGPAGAADALARSLPVSLRIPAVGVDTPVMQLGLAADGTSEVPPIAANDKAGWYRHSPTPGQVGPSVILGHRTVGAYGDGVFRHLARLRRGERIVARLENGTEAVFTVSSLRTVAQADFPTEAVYGDVSRPELRLITCGGPQTEDGYRDSVIVFATLNRPDR